MLLMLLFIDIAAAAPSVHVCFYFQLKKTCLQVLSPLVISESLGVGSWLGICKQALGL